MSRSDILRRAECCLSAEVERVKAKTITWWPRWPNFFLRRKCWLCFGQTPLFESPADPGVPACVGLQGENVPAWGQDLLECASSWQTEAELAARGGVATWDDAKRVLDVYKRADWGGLQVSSGQRWPGSSWLLLDVKGRPRAVFV